MTKLAPLALARTRPFQASRLATVYRCALRYLFETELQSPSLPDTLPTILGRAAHRVLKTANARRTHPKTLRSLLLEMTLADLATSTARVPQWAVRHGLLRNKGVIPTDMLGARVRFVIARLAKGGERGGRRVEAERCRFGSEIRLESSEFDLVGVADRVDLEAPRCTVVTEFKTGALRVEPGDAHRIQLLAYGLMAARRDGHAVALRALSPTGEWHLEFGRQAEDEIVKALNAAQARLPRDVPVQAKAVAMPGRACLDCRHRPICTAYGAWVSGAWRESTGGAPLDVWGTAARVAMQGDLLDLLVLEDNGFVVRVAGVAIGEGEHPPIEGTQMRLFDLASAESFRSNRRPLNYLAVDRGNVRGSAWSSAVEW
jgi:hypothetical protein